jgi:hypothetical protein
MQDLILFLIFNITIILMHNDLVITEELNFEYAKKATEIWGARLNSTCLCVRLNSMQ